MDEMPDGEEIKSLTMDNKVQKIMDKFSDIPVVKIVSLSLVR